MGQRCDLKRTDNDNRPLCFEIVANGIFKGCLCERELAAGLMNEKKSKEIKSTNVLVFLR